MRTKIYALLFGIALFLPAVSIKAQAPSDSLAAYIREAIANNPDVKASFYEYQAFLQRVPQAGAYADPELSFSFFAQPMEQLMGKQVATIELMQMFPWFGTKKIARSEAQEMAQMKFEAVRDKKATLEEQVKVKWYGLLKLQAQHTYLNEQLALLRQIEQLSLQKVASPEFSSRKKQKSISAASVVTPSSSASMGGMNGMAAASAQPANTESPKMAGNGMSAMSGGMADGMDGSGGALSDVLRIQLEIMKLENEIQTVISTIRTEEVAFNTLLNRDINLPVLLGDSLAKRLPNWEGDAISDLLIANNPMLAMLKSEEKAATLKKEMDHKMSLPMFGIGLEYMINAKTGTSGASGEMDGMSRMETGGSSMNGKDMIMPMVKVSLPIFRKKYKAQAKENSYYEQMVREKYASMYNMLQNNYASLSLAMANADRKLQLYEKQLNLANSTLLLVSTNFSTGKSSLTDIIQVEQQLRDLNFKKIEAVEEYNVAVVAIEKMIFNATKTQL